jgi:hypothetical protein
MPVRRTVILACSLLLCVTQFGEAQRDVEYLGAEEIAAINQHLMVSSRLLTMSNDKQEVQRDTINEDKDLMYGEKIVAPQRHLEETWVKLGNDIDGEAAGDFSGNSIALAVDSQTQAVRVAIGAPFNHGDQSDPGVQLHNGHVRVYEYDSIAAGSSATSSSWLQVGNDMNGEEIFDSFGSIVVLSANGKRVAACAPLNFDEFNQITGHVQILEEDETTGQWLPVGGAIHGLEHKELFGAGLALSADGTRVAVGAPFYSVKLTSAGQVRVFEETDGIWMQLGSSIDGEGEFDECGGAVTMSADGTRIAIGAKHNDGGVDSSGHVRVYELQTNGASGNADWVQVGSDIDGDAGKDHTGESVALSSDGRILAVGASRSFAMTGSVQIYEEVGNQGWVSLGNAIVGEHPGGLAGFSLDISDDGHLLVVGAPRAANANGDATGAARAYEYDAILSDWRPLGDELWGEAADDLFGGVVTAVVTSTNTVALAVAAPGNDSNGYYSGHVRAFTLTRTAPVAEALEEKEGTKIDEATLVALPVDVCQCALKTKTCESYPLRPQDDLMLCFSTEASHLQFNMVYSMTLSQEPSDKSRDEPPLHMEVIHKGGILANEHTLTSVMDAGAVSLVQTRPMTAFFVSSDEPSELVVSGIVQMALTQERKNSRAADRPVGRQDASYDTVGLDPSSSLPATSFSIVIELQQHDHTKTGFPTFQAAPQSVDDTTNTSAGKRMMLTKSAIYTLIFAGVVTLAF